MSVSLVVLLPILLLGIVSVFCFVGCVLQTHGIPFTQYSKLLVLGTQGIAAYWPLDETNDTLPAHDGAPNPVPGKYVDPNTLGLAPVTPGTIYLWPQVPVPNPPGPDAVSAAGPGQLSLGQPGLVKGDAKQPGDDPSILTTCMTVNGGYVQVPFDPKWNPPSFTLEAWVQVGWTANTKVDPLAWRAVLDGRGQNTQDPNAPCQGFAIMAMPDDKQPPQPPPPAPPVPPVYHWTVIVGNGASGFAGFSFLHDTGPQITLANPNPAPEQPPAAPVYLAVTYDAASMTLTLFVDGVQRAQQMNQPFVANTASPLYIGAGAPYAPNRQMSGSTSGGPLFPFFGSIQDVAIYSVVLSPTDIHLHFNDGS
jgi:hypothetical protein